MIKIQIMVDYESWWVTDHDFLFWIKNEIAFIEKSEFRNTKKCEFTKNVNIEV